MMTGKLAVAGEDVVTIGEAAGAVATVDMDAVIVVDLVDAGVIDLSSPVIDRAYNTTYIISIIYHRPKLNSRMSIVEFVLVSGDFTGEWVETSKCWKWRSFTKVTITIPVRCNSSNNEFVASVMQSSDLDCALSVVVISYVMH
ncbi:hypothetical protein BC332_06375 [Capsicum chinense]|nr:hypothetical protein BC332_06375 [Capsicum chinense]